MVGKPSFSIVARHLIGDKVRGERKGDEGQDSDAM
jgi:hypothetical protein